MRERDVMEGEGAVLRARMRLVPQVAAIALLFAVCFGIAAFARTVLLPTLAAGPSAAFVGVGGLVLWGALLVAYAGLRNSALQTKGNL